MATTFSVESDIENREERDVVVLDGRVRLGGRAKLTAGTRIEPPVLVASGARILAGVTLRKYSYVGRNTIVTRAEIGPYTSIAHNCQINYFRGHPTQWLSTHPFQYDEENFKFWSAYGSFSKRPFDGDSTQAPVVIGPDVWLGADVFIFGNVSIGPGAVVGARAMVLDDVPAYGVAIGSPAVTKRYRFDEATIRRLLDVKWWTRGEDVLRDMPFDDVQACLLRLEKR